MWCDTHALGRDAAALLTSRLGTAVDEDPRWAGTMVTVPLPERAGRTKEDAGRLRDARLFEDRIEVQLHAWRDRLWVRVSAQVCTDIHDIERLASALMARLCAAAGSPYDVGRRAAATARVGCPALRTRPLPGGRGGRTFHGCHVDE